MRETVTAGAVEYEVAVIGQTSSSESAVVARYTRNYPLLNTFAHFQSGGRHFALYAPDYRRTRVMEILPERGYRDLGEEPAADDGFCPGEYIVPVVEDTLAPGLAAPPASMLLDPPDAEGRQRVRFPALHGFVAGWLANDPETWLVYHLDLSRATDGQISRSASFGRAELFPGTSLGQVLDGSLAARTWFHSEGPLFRLAMPVCFHVGSGRRVEVVPPRAASALHGM